MGSICRTAQSQETGFKHRLWNQGLNIRGMKSLGGVKIQRLSECHIGQCKHRHVPTGKKKKIYHKKKVTY